MAIGIDWFDEPQGGLLLQLDRNERTAPGTESRLNRESRPW